MSKDDEKTSSNDEDMFYGEANKGVPHADMERMMVSWVIKHFGEKYGMMLWMNTLPDLEALDISVEEDWDILEEHVTLIFDNKAEGHLKSAQEWWYDDRTWTIEFQLDYRTRQYVKLFLRFQRVCRGEALRQVEFLTVKKASEIRKHFKIRFGGSLKEVIKVRQDAFNAGMPEPGKKPFPLYCDMELVLIKLEKEREFFWRSCSISKRDEYVFCQESKLVEVIIQHLPFEYACVLEKFRTQLEIKGLIVDKEATGFSEEQDVDQAFSNDWYPKYPELRLALIRQFHLYKQKWTQEGTKVNGVPVMMMGGHMQPGVGNLTCDACGIAGHKRGDPSCNAKPNDVWEGAPEAWKKRQRSPGNGRGRGRGRGKGGNGNGKGGGGKGRGNQRKNNQGNGKNQDRDDGICRNYSTGNGYCRFGDNCKFLHTGKKGGGGGDSGAKNTPSVQKLTQSVLKTLCKEVRSAKKKKRKQYDAEDDDLSSSSVKKRILNIMSLNSDDDDVSMMILAEDQDPKCP